MQAYYAADGSYIGNVGDSDEKRVIKGFKNTNLASISVQSANEGSSVLNTFLQENSVQGFETMDEAAISFGNEIAENEAVKTKEFGAKIGSKEVTNEDGSNSRLFTLGSTESGGFDGAGEYVDFIFSNLPEGFDNAGAIHTHTNSGNAEEFSPARDPNNPFLKGDRSLVYSVRNLYLATPKGALKVLSIVDSKVKERTVPVKLPSYDD